MESLSKNRTRASRNAVPRPGNIFEFRIAAVPVASCAQGTHLLKAAVALGRLEFCFFQPAKCPKSARSLLPIPCGRRSSPWTAAHGNHLRLRLLPQALGSPSCAVSSPQSFVKEDGLLRGKDDKSSRQRRDNRRDGHAAASARLSKPSSWDWSIAATTSRTSAFSHVVCKRPRLLQHVEDTPRWTPPCFCAIFCFSPGPANLPRSPQPHGSHDLAGLGPVTVACNNDDICARPTA